jgi:hypothetical protein
MSSLMPVDTESAERAIVSFLKEPDSANDLTGVDIECGSNRDARVGPTHIFALCRELRHNGSGVYVADVAVTLVTNIDDTSNEERRRLRDRVNGRLNKPTEDRSFVDTDTWMRCHGWFVTGPTEVSEGSNDAIGDVFALTVGLTRVPEGELE